jgi:ABC-type dipeptide/oligopeptide/nickel transport system permease subunit
MATQAINLPLEEPRTGRSPFGMAMRRLLRKKLAVVALVVIAAFYLCALFANLIAPYGYNDQDLDASFESPGWAHPFGTDRLGRDQLSRVIYSTRATAIVTAATLLTGGLVLGVGLGLLAGYKGGRVDMFIMRVGDVFFALPGLLMLILFKATLSDPVRDAMLRFEVWSGWEGLVDFGVADYFVLFGALALFSWVGTARLIRSQVLALREAEFIVAARAAGASTTRILWSHLLPNVSNLIIVGLSAGLGAIAGSEIALSWLGLGVQPPAPSFGRLINEFSGPFTLRTYPYLLLFPALVVAALLYAFNLLGDALNDVLNPRRR